MERLLPLVSRAKLARPALARDSSDGSASGGRGDSRAAAPRRFLRARSWLFPLVLSLAPIAGGCADVFDRDSAASADTAGSLGELREHFFARMQTHMGEPYLAVPPRVDPVFEGSDSGVQTVVNAVAQTSESWLAAKQAFAAFLGALNAQVTAHRADFSAWAKMAPGAQPPPQLRPIIENCLWAFVYGSKSKFGGGRELLASIDGLPPSVRKDWTALMDVIENPSPTSDEAVAVLERALAKSPQANAAFDGAAGAPERFIELLGKAKDVMVGGVIAGMALMVFNYGQKISDDLASTASDAEKHAKIINDSVPLALNAVLMGVLVRLSGTAQTAANVPLLAWGFYSQVVTAVALIHTKEQTPGIVLEEGLQLAQAAASALLMSAGVAQLLMLAGVGVSQTVVVPATLIGGLLLSVAFALDQLRVVIEAHFNEESIRKATRSVLRRKNDTLPGAKRLSDAAIDALASMATPTRISELRSLGFRADELQRRIPDTTPFVITAGQSVEGIRGLLLAFPKLRRPAPDSAENPLLDWLERIADTDGITQEHMADLWKVLGALEEAKSAEVFCQVFTTMDDPNPAIDVAAKTLGCSAP